MLPIRKPSQPSLVRYKPCAAQPPTPSQRIQPLQCVQNLTARIPHRSGRRMKYSFIPSSAATSLHCVCPVPFCPVWPMRRGSCKRPREEAPLPTPRPSWEKSHSDHSVFFTSCVGPFVYRRTGSPTLGKTVNIE